MSEAPSELDQQLVEALEAHARGSFGVIATIASARQVTWREACALYPDVFRTIAEGELRRIENLRASRPTANAQRYDASKYRRR